MSSTPIGRRGTSTTLEAVAREIGQALTLATMPLLRARLALIVGDDAPAMALAQRGGSASSAASAGAPMLGECLMLRADVLARAGDPAAARELLREASEIYAGLGDDGEIRACRLMTADVWRREGRLDEALPLVEAELPFLGEVGALDTVWRRSLRAWPAGGCWPPPATRARRASSSWR